VSCSILPSPVLGVPSAKPHRIEPTPIQCGNPFPQRLMAASAHLELHAPRAGLMEHAQAQHKANTRLKGCTLCCASVTASWLRANPCQDSQDTTASRWESCDTPPQRPRHRATPKCGVAGDHRALSLASGAWSAAVDSPGETMWPQARCAAISMAASWTCCDRARSCSPSHARCGIRRAVIIIPQATSTGKSW